MGEGDDSDPRDFNSQAEQSEGGDPIKDKTNQSYIICEIGLPGFSDGLGGAN